MEAGISGILGIVAMVLVGWLKAKSMTSEQKYLILFGVSLVFGLAQTFWAGQLILDKGTSYLVIVQNLSIIVTTATTLYKLYFAQNTPLGTGRTPAP